MVTSKCICVQDVCCSISEGGESREIISNISECFETGYLYTIRGESGVGKTTLLNILSGIRAPEKGEVFWENWPLYYKVQGVKPKKRKAYERDLKRPEVMGFVFQDIRLALALNGWQNIVLPARLRGQSVDEQWIKKLIGLFFSDFESDKVDKLLKSKPASTLSGGEQERVAAIRALSLKPPFLLADEILGSVSPHKRKKIWTGLKCICRCENIGVILVTHDNLFLSDREVDYPLILKDGNLNYVSN